jgi:hypothetical protein
MADHSGMHAILLIAICYDSGVGAHYPWYAPDDLTIRDGTASAIKSPGPSRTR